MSIVDKPVEHEHFGFIAFCTVSTILLAVLMIGCALHLRREQVIKINSYIRSTCYIDHTFYNRN